MFLWDVLQHIFTIFEHNCRYLAIGWLARDLPSISSFSGISYPTPLVVWLFVRQLAHLLGDNNVVSINMWWREILLKREKVYEYFFMVVLLNIFTMIIHAEQRFFKFKQSSLKSFRKYLSVRTRIYKNQSINLRSKSVY